jgi:antitoxin component YwqK of YwqJK toxin-antitoxin module
MIMATWTSAQSYISLFFVATLALSSIGCKLRIVVLEGGRVVSESAAFNCQPTQKCTIDVSDVFFNETFQAVPADGYFFRRWKAGNLYLCADTYQNCPLSTASFAGKPALEQLLESDEIFSLGPLFAAGSCQPSRIETTDGFQNILVDEGQKCTATGQTQARYQGLVRRFRNGKLIELIGWDLGRMQGEAKNYYNDGITLRETSYYRRGKYHGEQKQYDEQGRLLVKARWQEGRLHGNHTTYDYSKAYLYNGNPSVTMSHYDSGQLSGDSRTDYPNGVWELRQWLEGVQYGLYEVFVPSRPGEVGGWRYVYVFVDGLIRYGYGYQRTAIGDNGEFKEVGGPHSAWVWECPYINGVLDETTCFRDGLDLEPRL